MNPDDLRIVIGDKTIEPIDENIFVEGDRAMWFIRNVSRGEVSTIVSIQRGDKVVRIKCKLAEPEILLDGEV